MKSKQKKFYNKWWFWLIVGIVFLFIIGSFLILLIVGSFLLETEDEIKEEIEPQEEPQQETLGISYNQMMNYLSNFFTMEKSTPVDGQDRYMGETSSGLAILEIIGEKEDITQTTLLIGIPSDNYEILIENSAILIRFLKNAVPEWEESSDWATTSLEKMTESTSTREEEIYGNKLIKMYLIREFGMVTVTVEPA